MIDIGVARPAAGTSDDQHRDRVDKRVRQPWLGPGQLQTMKAITATATTAGTNQSENDQPTLDWRTEAGFATIRTICEA